MTVTGHGPQERSKRLVEIDLLGRRFRVRSDDDDAYIRELTDFVNRKLSEVRHTSNLVETEQIALLALLDVADSLFREKNKNEALKRRVRERSRRLLASIDQLGQALGSSEVEAESLAIDTPHNGS